MCLVRDRLSVAERLIDSESSSESVAKTDSLGRGDGRTGVLSFLGRSSGGFSGEGTALTFAVFQDEPDADRFLASLAEVQPPPIVVVGLPPATRSAAVSRGWV